MPAPAKTLEEAGPCRNKPKASMTLSEEAQAQQDADDAFLLDIRAGALDKVADRLRKGQKVNVGTDGGESAVHCAVKSVQGDAKNVATAIKLIEKLVEHGAYVDYPDNYG